MGMTTKANTAYNVAALLAKGEALFNLGVLNGPDLEVIRRTLPDPSTFKGASADKAAIDEAVGQVSALLKARLAAKEKQIGMAQPGATPKGGADREKLLFDARKAIEQGAPRDAVIQRLKENGVEDGL
jgi:hypothetical protein